MANDKPDRSEITARDPLGRALKTHLTSEDSQNMNRARWAKHRFQKSEKFQDTKTRLLQELGYDEGDTPPVLVETLTEAIVVRDPSWVSAIGTLLKLSNRGEAAIQKPRSGERCPVCGNYILEFTNEKLLMLANALEGESARRKAERIGENEQDQDHAAGG